MFRALAILGIIGTVGACLLHLLVFGPRHKEAAGGERVIRRFSILERLAHALTLVSFLTLAATGFYSVLAGREALRGLLLLCHYYAAPAFAVGAAVIVAGWSADAGFKPYDLRWMVNFGGYLWKRENLPAGRFNAGQKVYFWIVATAGFAVILSGLGRLWPVLDETGQWILLWVHRLSALFLAAWAIAHAYLGTLANPGTVQAMLTGRVSEKWARTHHPLWEKSGKDKETSS